MVYVSTPFQSTTASTWQLSLSKRVAARDGSFLGVVTGVVKLPSFDDVLEKVALGRRVAVSVFQRDGTIIACFPQREFALGANDVDSSLRSHLSGQEPDGVVRQTSEIDRVDRLFAIVHSTHFPVVSVVAVAMDDFLAAWLHQAEALAFAATVIVLTIAMGTTTIAVYVERLADAQARAAIKAKSPSSTSGSTTRWTTSSRGWRCTTAEAP